MPTIKIPGNKKGAYHKYGIVYYDKANRDGGVATTPDMQVYVKTLPEIFGASNYPVYTDSAYQSYVQMSINNVPPDWAETYQIVYAKNNLRKYTQFMLKGNPDPVSVGYKLDCTYLFDYIENGKVVTSVNIQFEKGDRLRFISNAEFYCTTYVDVEVVSLDVTTKSMIVRNFNLDAVSANMAVPTFEGATVEYFAYKSNIDPQNEFYFEMGEVYSVIAPHTPQRRHAGNVSNQNSGHTLPAVVKMTRGDTYIYKRYFKPTTVVVPIVVESQDFSDFYESSNFDFSRVQGVRNEKTRKHAQQLRYGGRYFPDTLTNNLLSFGGADYDTLQTNYGPINKIINIGYTLKCLQTKKVTSIYVNRQMIFNADGSQDITLTNMVIGSKEPSNLDYGCANPESVCKDDRQIYFFDINNGAVIQDSANGMFPISGYKMATYFKNKAEEIRNTGGSDKIFVYADSDNYNETVNFIFSDENTTPTNFNSTTIIYGTRNNRWSSFQSYVGDYIVSNALTLISYKDGAMYVHNDNSAPRCNFYGVQYGSKIKFVVNNNPEVVKTFDWLGVNSNKIWTSPNDIDITTPANANYSVGMASRLVEGRFRAKEGVFYADYARDLNTPNVTNPIMNGQRLRGTYMVQQIENNDTVRVNLFSVLIHNTYSLISG